MRPSAALLSLALSCSLAGCASSGASTKPTASTKSLYDRLGGQPAITAVVGEFLGNVGKDDRINARFSNTDMPHLKQMLIEQICQVSGGPCKYTGKDMRTVHTGLKITDEEFTALVEDLKHALDNFKVGAPEQNELVGALGAMKPDVVGL